MTTKVRSKSYELRSSGALRALIVSSFLILTSYFAAAATPIKDAKLSGTLDASAVSNKSTVLSDLGAAAASHTHTENNVTNLVTDLAGKQPHSAVLDSFVTAAGHIDWSVLDNKPATFAPSAHTHPESDVTNLAADLAAKAAKASNLSDLASASTARTNLGLGTASVLNTPASGNAAVGEVVKGSDTRLSDARTPTAHSHPESDITNLVSDLAAKLSSLPNGNLLYVDAVNGNNTTAARGRADKPYLTLTAAKTAASGGDTIIVRPGTYNERDLLKNGVNWHFINGAIVNYTGSEAGSMFGDTLETGGPVTCSITGDGIFKNASTFIEDDARVYNGVIAISDPGSNVFFECRQIWLANSLANGSGAVILDAGNLVVRAKDFIRNDIYDAIWVAGEINGGGIGYIETPLVYVSATGDNLVEGGSGGDVTIRASKMVSLNYGVDAFNCAQPGVTIDADEISGGGVRMDNAGITVRNATITMASTVATQAFRCLRVSAGAKLLNCRVVQQHAGDPVLAVTNDGGVVQNTTLVAPSDATYSMITGGAAQTILADNVVANKPFHANVAATGNVTVSGRQYLAALVPSVSTVTYSTSMTIDASLANRFVITATNSTAFTIAAPTNLATGQNVTVTIRNTSGGALGTATWNAVFKMASWTQPANGFSRSITFNYNGTNWIETSRTPADVPN